MEIKIPFYESNGRLRICRGQEDLFECSLFKYSKEGDDGYYPEGFAKVYEEKLEPI